MKKLILIRHAKSSWEHAVSDQNRPLNFKGFNDANNLSKALIGQINPDIVFSSDALRAKTTAEIFLLNLGIANDNLVLNHHLYDFSGNKLVNVIKNTPKTVDELLVFGHNNAITAFVNSYGNRYIDNVPTCGVVMLEFDTDHWDDIQKGKTIRTMFPRDLK